jgi:pimeloyl-ACP methyl ester carboxylesterase
MPYTSGSGVRIHFEVEGSGTPLVLYPGFMGSVADWYSAGYVDALKGDNTLVLLDPRGQGDSEKPHESAAYSPDQRVADVIGVLDALSIGQADFLGYSLGGRLGFVLGHQAPKRIRSLMIGGAQPFGYAPMLTLAEPFRQGMATAIAEYERTSGPLDADRRARWLTADPAACVATLLTEWPSLEPVLGAMHVPILLYCAERDASHERAQHAAALLPNATFVSLPGLTHREGMFNCAASLPHITAFLRRVRAGAGAPAASS